MGSGGGKGQKEGSGREEVGERDRGTGWVLRGAEGEEGWSGMERSSQGWRGRHRTVREKWS
eukprot:2229570-Rhodomonas_salina.1